MTYVTGFLTPVPDQNKAAYLDQARKAWTICKEYGALSVAECWGADVPEGTLTSMPAAVKLEPGETVVFTWMTWPDKASADACFASASTDPRWAEMTDRPFDGKRLIYGGFSVIFDG